MTENRAQRRFILNKMAAKDRPRFKELNKEHIGATEAIRQMQEHWLKVVDKNVPWVFRWIATFIPPVFYERTMNRIAFFFLWLRMKWMAYLINRVCIYPFHVIKRFVYTAGGMKSMVVRVGNEFHMEIRHWGKIIDNSVWEVRK